MKAYVVDSAAVRSNLQILKAVSYTHLDVYKRQCAHCTQQAPALSF